MTLRIIGKQHDTVALIGSHSMTHTVEVETVFDVKVVEHRSTLKNSNSNDKVVNLRKSTIIYIDSEVYIQ